MIKIANRQIFIFFFDFKKKTWVRRTCTIHHNYKFAYTKFKCMKNTSLLANFQTAITSTLDSIVISSEMSSLTVKSLQAHWAPS